MPSVNYSSAYIFSVSYRFWFFLSLLTDRTLFTHIAADRTRAVHEFLATLPQSHRICLCHVMNHLDFVWSHQRKLRDYLNTNDPDRGLSQFGHGNTTTSSSCTGSGLSVSWWCRAQNNYLTQPNNWLLVFRQILIRPPWHLVSHIATKLSLHLQALNVVFYALAKSLPPSAAPVRRTSPSSPAVFRPRLPSSLSGSLTNVNARISASGELITCCLMITRNVLIHYCVVRLMHLSMVVIRERKP